VKILNNKNNNFKKDLISLLNNRFDANIGNKIEKDVKNILNEVKNKGNKALFKFSKRFDNIVLNESNLKIPKKILEKQENKIDKKVFNSFKIAIKNITKFHRKQFPKNYEINSDNIKAGSIWKPIDSVGLYIPGGKAVYPSSLIMNIVPAKIAGVKRIVVTTPSQNGKFNPYVLALLNLFNIDEIYQLGGAQAIAALAYGTETIKSVNKIFGPGNAYVTTAKKNVFGKVGIDLIAGPSEIIVVADKENNPAWVASDLIAQAEHDEKAQSILITDSEYFAKKVISNINNFVKKLSTKNIIKKSLKNYGAIIIVDNLNSSAEIINLISPEHLHLQNKSSNYIFKHVRNAGAIFIGQHSSEAFGDYIVGTNHVLPTSSTSRFSSGLGVLDFMKRTSYVKMNKISSRKFSKHVVKMADIENLEGHKLSVKIRQKEKK
tara:strand:- start:147 stop:1445 length:1299 start_codon:yes stop_codon:yes gene_type:complete